MSDEPIPAHAESPEVRSEGERSDSVMAVFIAGIMFFLLGCVLIFLLT